MVVCYTTYDSIISLLIALTVAYAFCRYCLNDNTIENIYVLSRARNDQVTLYDVVLVIMFIGLCLSLLAYHMPIRGLQMFFILLF